MADEDGDLVQRFLVTGSVDDFETLVRRHQQNVFKIAVAVLGRGSEARAEDVTQDVMLQVFASCAPSRPEAALPPGCTALRITARSTN